MAVQLNERAVSTYEATGSQNTRARRSKAKRAKDNKKTFEGSKARLSVVVASR
jgi:hypothetical protein